MNESKDTMLNIEEFEITVKEELIEDLEKTENNIINAENTNEPAKKLLRNTLNINTKFKCKFCEEYHESDYHLDLHIQRIHSDELKESEKCELFGQTWPSRNF